MMRDQAIYSDHEHAHFSPPASSDDQKQSTNSTVHYSPDHSRSPSPPPTNDESAPLQEQTILDAVTFDPESSSSDSDRTDSSESTQKQFEDNKTVYIPPTEDSTSSENEELLHESDVDISVSPNQLESLFISTGSDQPESSSDSQEAIFGEADAKHHSAVADAQQVYNSSNNTTLSSSSSSSSSSFGSTTTSGVSSSSSDSSSNSTSSSSSSDEHLDEGRDKFDRFRQKTLSTSSGNQPPLSLSSGSGNQPPPLSLSDPVRNSPRAVTTEITSSSSANLVKVAHDLAATAAAADRKKDSVQLLVDQSPDNPDTPVKVQVLRVTMTSPPSDDSSDRGINAVRVVDSGGNILQKIMSLDDASTEAGATAAVAAAAATASANTSPTKTLSQPSTPPQFPNDPHILASPATSPTKQTTIEDHQDTLQPPTEGKKKGKFFMKKLSSDSGIASHLQSGQKPTATVQTTTNNK